MKKSNFTLLEVLCAMVILTTGISLLLWQLSDTITRLEQNNSSWEQIHDLTQAAEFILIHGNEVPVNQSIFRGDYEVRHFFSEPDLKLEKLPLARRMLKKLTIQLWRNGAMVDELMMDTFVEEANYAK